jgi:small subunit ribosomal protein S6
MRKYEALVIVDARLEEGDIQKAVDRFLQAVADSGGEVHGVDRWGARRFTYQIYYQKEKHNEGYYFVTNFMAPETAVDQLRAMLQVSDEFIRGKIVQPV